MKRATRRARVSRSLGSFECPIVLSLVLLGSLLAIPPGCKKKAQATHDLSSPSAAALTFARSLDAGDAAGAKSAALSGGIENDLLDAMALSIPAQRKLYATARDRFGEAAAKALVQQTSVHAVSLIAESEIAMDETGKIATLTTKDGKNSLQVKKVADGEWKVDVGAMIRGQDVTQMVPMLRALATAATDVAAQISAGKIDSGDEARLAMARAQFRAMTGSEPGTRSASTSPSTAPAVGGGR